MNETLIQKSDLLSTKAIKLMSIFPFQKLAEKHFGNLTYVGSAVTNLMVDADIDSNIILKPIDIQKIMDFAKELTDIKLCRRVILYNRTYEEVPYFIINVERFRFEDEVWTLTFFIEEEDFQNSIKTTNDIRSKLTEEKRRIILDLKAFRLENKYKWCISSAMLYEAVFKDNVLDVESFKEYLSKNNVALKSED